MEESQRSLGEVDGESSASLTEVYSAGEDRPLAGLSVLLLVYAAFVALLVLVVRATGRSLPQRVSFGDLALITVATHKVSRLIAKDPVTSPLRAPFTRFAGRSADAELSEEVRGTGLRKAIGELVTCPFCLGLWVATALVAGVTVAPRATRLVTATFTALAGSDFLHYLYSRVQQATES